MYKRTFEQIVADEGREWIDRQTWKGFSFTRIDKRIVCADGESLSIQTSALTYCTPRSNCGPYTKVEVGFPSATPPDSWDEYRDDSKEAGNETVWAYVPVELVRAFIEAHGGEKERDENAM